MKMYQKLFTTAAVVASALVFSGCQDIVDDEDRTMSQIKMYNVDGVGISGFNAVTATGVSIMTGQNGVIKYADSSVVDVKVQNNNGRAVNSTITGTIVTLNGTKFAAITADQYANASKRDLKNIGDGATATSMDIDASPYFIAKLMTKATATAPATVRGYCLGMGVKNASDISGSASNTGSVTLDYYFFTDAEIN